MKINKLNSALFLSLILAACADGNVIGNDDVSSPDAQNQADSQVASGDAADSSATETSDANISDSADSSSTDASDSSATDTNIPASDAGRMDNVIYRTGDSTVSIVYRGSLMNSPSQTCESALRDPSSLMQNCIYYSFFGTIESNRRMGVSSSFDGSFNPGGVRFTLSSSNILAFSFELIGTTEFVASVSFRSDQFRIPASDSGTSYTCSISVTGSPYPISQMVTTE